MLHRTKLKKTTDEEGNADSSAGVEYFLATLRPYFVRGVQNVFLFRLFQFLKMRRGNSDIIRWIAKYQINSRRLMDAWMEEILQILDKPSIPDETKCLTNP